MEGEALKKLVICGGKPLQGTVDIHGAKNSILPILSACLVCPERCVITRCPEISDVEAALQILQYLGCRAEHTGSAAVVDASEASVKSIPPQLAGTMRASVNFLGAMLARFGQGELSMPGGCSLGMRPIDYHVSALKTLGVQLEETPHSLRFSWPKRESGEVVLPFPSVGATENVILAAISVPGTVELYGAAREPEIQDLCGFLTAMGAEIVGAGTPTIKITGGKTLHAATYRVLPDRIEAATYLAMAAACGGELVLRDVRPEHLTPVLQILQTVGCDVEEENHTIRLCRKGELLPGGSIETRVYPGFPTDAQAPVMAALLRSRGETNFRETVFSQRFRHVEQLRKFGADIEIHGDTATVRGVKSLFGTHAEATDLRGGAGVLIAALQAEGESVIQGLHYVDRGYASLSENLRTLGAELYEDS